MLMKMSARKMNELMPKNLTTLTYVQVSNISRHMWFQGSFTVHYNITLPPWRHGVFILLGFVFKKLG